VRLGRNPNTDRRVQRRSEALPCTGTRGRDRLPPPQAIFDNVTRSGEAFLEIINDILERDLTAAIDGLKALIGDVHVAA
jgi:hypothetical protein